MAKVRSRDGDASTYAYSPADAPRSRIRIRCCWESDFPHSDGTWPNAPERIVETLGGLDDALVNKITHENAMAIYDFDPFAHRPKEKCTAAALRAESPDVDVVTRVGREAGERDLEAWRELTSGARRGR